MAHDPKRIENVLAGVENAPRETWEFARDIWRAVKAVARGFRGENISLRAAALTYVSLLALVPLGALGLAIAKAVGHEKLRAAVRDFALAQLAPGAEEGTLQYFDQFMSRAGSGILGTLGVIFLIFSALELLWNIERSLNEIWAVPKHRPWAPRLAVYWAVLTVGPIILGLSVAGTSTVEATLAGIGLIIPRWLSYTLHIGASTIGLTTLYWVTPNAPVRIRSAFAGGIVAAAAWEIAKNTYGIYTSRSFSYGAIYGALAAIPFFFIWIYVSWWIVLFGARLAYAVQNAGASGQAAGSVRAREILCSEVLIAVCRRFLDGATGTAPADLVSSGRASESEVRQALGILQRAKLVAEEAGGGFVPARHPKSMTLADVSQAVFGAKPAPNPPNGKGEGIAAYFADADEAGTRSLSKVDLASLCEPRPAETPLPTRALAKP